LKERLASIIAILFVLSVLMAGTTFSEPEKVELVAWKWMGNPVLDPKLEEIINMWNQEHPDTPIKFTVFPELSEAEFIVKVEQATEAGQGPDLIHGSDVLLAVLASDGYLESVPEDVMSVIKEYILENYIELLTWWGPDGVKRVYGGWISLDGPKVLFVNEYHLEEAGYPKDWCPADWNELLEAAIKLTKRNPDGSLNRSGLFVRVAGHVGGIFDKFEPIFRSAGGKLLWCENGEWKTDINSEPGLRTVQLYLDILYKHKIYEMGFPGDSDAFANELISMLLDRETEYIGYFYTVNPRFRGPEGPVGFHPCPIPPPEKGMPSRTSSHMHGWTINAKTSSEKKKVAWEFIKWLHTNPEVKKKYIEIGYWIPYKDVVNQPPFTNPVYQKGTEIAIETSGSRIYHPKIGLIHNAVGKWLHLIFTKQIDPKEGLDNAARDLLEIASEIPCKG